MPSLARTRIRAATTRSLLSGRPVDGANQGTLAPQRAADTRPADLLTVPSAAHLIRALPLHPHWPHPRLPLLSPASQMQGCKDAPHWPVHPDCQCTHHRRRHLLRSRRSSLQVRVVVDGRTDRQTQTPLLGTYFCRRSPPMPIRTPSGFSRAAPTCILIFTGLWASPLLVPYLFTSYIIFAIRPGFLYRTSSSYVSYTLLFCSYSPFIQTSIFHFPISVATCWSLVQRT